MTDCPDSQIIGYPGYICYPEYFRLPAALGGGAETSSALSAPPTFPAAISGRLPLQNCLAPHAPSFHSSLQLPPLPAPLARKTKNKKQNKNKTKKKKDSTPECHSFHFVQPPLSQASTIAGLHYIRPPLFHASTIPPVFPTTYSDPAGFILSPPPAALPSNHPRHDEFTREALIHTTYG